ncbi:MAG: hypothetical protein ACTHU0_29725 [Kofleriaceae bacterium]
MRATPSEVEAGELARFGVPSEAAGAACTVRTIAREADPAWFDAWRSGALRAIAERDLGARLAELDAADHLHLIVADVEAPADLGYLQAAWGFARAAVAAGASIVLDVHAATFHAGEALPPADAALDVSHEVRTVFETSAGRARHPHALHTRGMRKFGAPDLIALCSDADAPLVGHALAELAGLVAGGTELALPRHAIELAAGVTWYAVEDEHRLADLLQLDNRARVVVDGAGHDLVGVIGRLPRATARS